MLCIGDGPCLEEAGATESDCAGGLDGVDLVWELVGTWLELGRLAAAGLGCACAIGGGACGSRGGGGSAKQTDGLG